MDHKDILRRHLATLAYRVRHALKEAPMGFEDFDAGMGVRTPEQIINHINSLLHATDLSFRGEKMAGTDELPYREAVEEFHALLQKLDWTIGTVEMPGDDTILRVYQGPLSDAMTHVGQLMLLRRLSGSPVVGGNYYRADIKNGELGPNQKLPV